MPEEDYVDPAANEHKPSDEWDPTVPDRGELIVVPECPKEGCPVCTAPMNNWNGCRSDDVCAEGLVCYDHRGDADQKTEQVSGCSENKIKNFGYCYSPDKSYQTPEIPHLLEAPTNEDFVLTNELALPEECAIYAVDHDATIDVPFNGSSGKVSHFLDDVCCSPPRCPLVANFLLFLFPF